jgi:hypothetical protein
VSVLSLALSLWLVAGAGATLNVELQMKLLAMGAADQSVRQNIRSSTSREEFDALAEKLNAVDTRNLAELDKIVEQLGWPGTDLEDRVLVGEGKKQLYGSQVVAGPDGLPRLHPIEDPENVDERRRAIGLPPLEEYLRRAEQDLGKHIERQ